MPANLPKAAVELNYPSTARNDCDIKRRNRMAGTSCPGKVDKISYLLLVFFAATMLFLFWFGGAF